MFADNHQGALGDQDALEVAGKQGRALAGNTRLNRSIEAQRPRGDAQHSPHGSGYMERDYGCSAARFANPENNVLLSAPQKAVE